LGTAPVASSTQPATHLQQLVATTQARADHPAVRLDHRLETCLQEFSAGLQRATRQDLVEPAARQHRQSPGDVDAPAARSDAGDELGALRLGHHGVEQAQPGQGVVRVGNQPVTADLVAADGLGIHQQHAFTRQRQGTGGSTSSRTSPDDQDVGRLKGTVQVFHRRRRWHGAGLSTTRRRK
jgi:hypothetical protein